MEFWVQLAEKQNYTVLAQKPPPRWPPSKRGASAPRTCPRSTPSPRTARPARAPPAARQLGGRRRHRQHDRAALRAAALQGGAISSREREAAALSLKSKDDLENVRRTAATTTRQNYLIVINGIAAIAALEQALVSSQSSLDSNKLGYEVGVRINIDVLNAQQQLYSTRRDLAVARYNTITNQLRLKSGAGSLREEDLREINRALVP